MKTSAMANRYGGGFGDERDRPVRSILPTITIPFYDLPQCSMFGADPITRISTSFRTAIATEPIGDANAPELYAMAKNECTILSEIF
jgi:hypothetical protein